MKLEHGDCLKLMKNIPDKSIDMILCDLPYGVTAAKWDSVIPMRPLWKQYKRIIKDHGCIALFGNEPFSSKLRMSNLKMYRYDWIWIKTHPSGFLQSHYRPLTNYENISIFYKHIPTYNPQFRKGKPYKSKNRKGSWSKGSGIFYDKNSLHLSSKPNPTGKRFPVQTIKFSNDHINSQHKRLHPTQKPVPLLKYLIRTYTDKHDLVLDNCMGSGSTGVACKQLNRNFIGMELNKHYFNVAKKRINSVSKPKELVKE